MLCVAHFLYTGVRNIACNSMSSQPYLCKDSHMMHISHFTFFPLHHLLTQASTLIAILCLSACQTTTPNSFSNKGEAVLETPDQTTGATHPDAPEHVYQEYKHQWQMLPFQEWLLPDNNDTPNTVFMALYEKTPLNAKHSQVEQWLERTDDNTASALDTRSHLVWMREHLSRQQQWLAQHPSLMTPASAWFVSVSERLLHTSISSVPDAHDYLDQLEQVPSLLSAWVDYLEDNPNARTRPNLEEFNQVVDALHQWSFSAANKGNELTPQEHNLDNILDDFSQKLAALNLYPENTAYIQKRANELHELRLKPALQTLIKTLQERQIGIVKAPPVNVVADDVPTATDTPSPSL